MKTPQVYTGPPAAWRRARAVPAEAAVLDGTSGDIRERPWGLGPGTVTPALKVDAVPGLPGDATSHLSEELPRWFSHIRGELWFRWAL